MQACHGRTVEPVREKVGRKPVPLADRVFSVVYKVWSTLSTRRFDCDLQDAVQRGYLSRTLHPNKINCFICEPELTPFLKAALAWCRGSLPLKAIETEFAVDSSGFSTSKFVRWFDQKYGLVKQEHDWVKVLQAAVGSPCPLSRCGSSPLLPPPAQRGRVPART